MLVSSQYLHPLLCKNQLSDLLINSIATRYMSYKICRVMGYLTLGLFCFKTSLSAQNYTPIFQYDEPDGYEYLEKLESRLAGSNDLETRLGLINDLAYYYHTRDLIKADSLTRVGLGWIEDDNALWRGRLLTTHGAILLRAERLDEAEGVLLKAKEILPRAEWPLLQTQLGYVAERRGLLDIATDYAELNIDLGRELDDLWAQAMGFSDLSNLFWKQSKFQQGLEYGLRSLSIFEERGIEDLDYSFTLYLVGNNYYSLKEFDRAIEVLEESIVISERYGFFNNLSDAYMTLMDVYMDTGEYEKAIENFNGSLRYARLLNNAFMEMRTWMTHGRLMNLMDQPVEAIESLNNSLAVATQQFGDEYWLQIVYEELAKAYAKLGNFEKAFEHFVEYDQLKEALFTAESDERIAKLQTEFETAQKEAMIALQRSRLSRQNIVLILIAGILLLTAISLFILWDLNKKLKNANKEKDFLLREIHHRVKNNLQILSSLLNLQSNYIEDKGALNAIQEGKNRVESMGLIHQKLYTRDDVTAVDMSEYIEQLASNLEDSFSSENLDLEIHRDVSISNLDVDSAIPLGLIVNELITNAKKYAFEGRSEGSIQVKLWIDDSNRLCLIVQDDGNGIPAVKSSDSTSFGTDLIKILSKKMKGDIHHDTSNGYSTEIRFSRYKLAG